MRGSRYIAILSLAALPAHANIVACMNSATTTTISCRQLSQQAKTNADRVSHDYEEKVKGKSVKQTSDMMVEATSKINDIYQSAQDSCGSAISQCVDSCSGDGAALAGACQQEMGKYVKQVSGGHDESQRGKDGGTLSSQNSSTMPKNGLDPKDAANKDLANSSEVDGGRDRVAGNSKISPGGLGSVSAEATAGTGGRASSGAQMSYASSGWGSGSNATGGVSSAAGVISQSVADADKDGLDPNAAAKAAVAAKAAAAARLSSANYNSPAREQLTRYMNSYYARATHASVAGRSPAGLAGPQAAVTQTGVGTSFGPSLFKIHSNVLNGMCWNQRLNCY